MSTGVIPLVGRVVKEDPVISFSNSGVPVTRFSLVTSARKMNKDTQQWEDQDTTYYNCVAFKSLAEAIAEQIERGDAVVLTGRLMQDEWVGKDGNTRFSIKVVVESLGRDLRWAKPKQASADEDPPF